MFLHLLASELFEAKLLELITTLMKFSIITPTHRRKEKLARAVLSLLAQTYKDWEMIIINDSPSDDAYKEFALSINDARIHYHVNLTNKGVNYSRNVALEKISADSKWVLFLDDDDYLAPDTLAILHRLILLHDDSKWFVTNRAYKNGTPVTHFQSDNTSYTYAWNYLILKRLKGDATHCVETKLITQHHIRFSNYVKQGEEWLFFYELGTHTKMFYHDHNSTITDGYDASSGLNFRKRSITEQFETISTLAYEGIARKIFYNPSFIIYIVARYSMLLIPKRKTNR